MKVGDIVDGEKLGPIKLIDGPYRNIAEMYEYRKMVDAEKISGYHSHECPYCQTRWIHGDENAGDQKEHTCPSCGRTIPLTLGTMQSSEGEKTWGYGWQKAGVIMPDGSERRVPVQAQAQPVLANNFLMHVQFYMTIILVSAMVATGVFYGMRWLEAQDAKPK